MQDEFERRRCSKEAWGGSDDGRQLTQEEEELRQTSRRKMVGNLRFIGELGKLQIIHKSILYHCIEEVSLPACWCSVVTEDAFWFEL